MTCTWPVSACPPLGRMPHACRNRPLAACPRLPRKPAVAPVRVRGADAGSWGRRGFVGAWMTSNANTSATLAPTILDVLEEHMNAAWPALDVFEHDGWVLRAAGSVTKRANSVWPRENHSTAHVLWPQETLPVQSSRAQDDRFESLLARTRQWYGERHQPVVFQVTDRSENSFLERFLTEKGYSRESETLIMAANTSITTASSKNHTLGVATEWISLEVSSSPTVQWLDLWCDIEGTVIGTGRVSVIDGWAGIYCMGVRPAYRRLGRRC